ncbi:MAG: restriction endonuclease [Ignavibacteria bacterium GWB2_35_6b]|nr:MAG: restriction endonuclease [Ignavibacteria bacterium GWB2_35_6b]
MTISKLREQYHKNICRDLLRIRNNANKGDYPNNADGDSKISVRIAWEITKSLSSKPVYGNITGQEAGNIFERLTKEFLENSFELFKHIRPGKWQYSMNTSISEFDQYKDLASIDKIVKKNKELASTLGQDYLISPDIVISRETVTDKELNKNKSIISIKDSAAKLTPLRRSNYEFPKPILHASISCKWTLRSDRGQNARTEALNLIRNRKGNLPHIVAVTAEPTTTRIASLALGTGDIDCVYHFALNELIDALNTIGDESQLDMLNTLVDGRRLRDISDLPFDLAV